MNNIQEQITSVWRVEQEILDVIHKICGEYGLRYSLAYGTLLGAVRHGGFIPWDDDVDLIMPREDYNKLLRIWNHAAPEGYILVNGDTSADYSNNFSKIVKDHTTFLQCEDDRHKAFHKGIFVDIFPGDRVAPGKIGQRLQYYACAVNLLFSRGYTSGSGGIIGIAERILLCFPKRFHNTFRQVSERYLAKWNTKVQTPYLFACTIGGSKKRYPSDLFDHMGSILFNGKEYCSASDTDRYLRMAYGDYMQLPPEVDRVWKHHPIIIDFEHNYDELPNKRCEADECNAKHCHPGV